MELYNRLKLAVYFIATPKEQLEIWKQEISGFLRERLKLELHREKSRIISLLRGIDFVGFRNFYNHRLLRKRNICSMKYKVKMLKENKISYQKFILSFQGWEAYSKWANSYNLTTKIIKSLN
jgi:RNA-directed DNA polymerase